jgi:glycosyltransferase involved in cell wall biosynthesis
VVEKHNCGIAYGNLNEFHDAVIKLYNDPGLRSKMGENGYNAILNEYNMENLSGNLKLLYNSIRN